MDRWDKLEKWAQEQKAMMSTRHQMIQRFPGNKIDLEYYEAQIEAFNRILEKMDSLREE